MRSLLLCSLLLVAAISGNVCTSAQSSATPEAVQKETIGPTSWKQILNYKDMDWFKSNEAGRIADNVLLCQTDIGGWGKDERLMLKVLSDQDKLRMSDKSRKASLDNGATHTQMLFLAKMYSATGEERYKHAFVKGVGFLLTSQYPNGGWPQWYPMRGATSYSNHITFNDGAMIGAMRVLDNVARDIKPYNGLADSSLRARCAEAVRKGVDCILKCQVAVDGRKTAWCAQHDEVTYAPAKARSYELPSLSGAESTGSVSFLMQIENPSSEVIKAVEGAVVWFDKVKITGIREIEVPDANTRRGFNRVHVDDSCAPPMWARFYEIGTDRPIYVDRDGSVKYRIADIESERRNGYRWTGRWGQPVLDAYPAWSEKHTPGRNVLLPVKQK